MLAMVALTVVVSGCASLPGTDAPRPAEPGASTAPGGRIGPAAVQVEIQAPADLKAQLERFLDLVRLGRVVSREDVDDSEWARLIDATPSQVRSLLQTEGYFQPDVRLERTPGTTAGQPDLVRLIVEPGQRVRIGRVTIEAEGELESGAIRGDAHAVATLDQVRRTWPMPAGSEFRNADWGDAKDAVLARLRAAGYANAVFSGTAAEVDVSKQEVRVFVAVDSGPLFRFGKLRIEGLATHDENTVGHLVGAARRARHREPAARLSGSSAEVRPLRRHQRHAGQRPQARQRSRGGGAAAGIAAAGLHLRPGLQRQHARACFG